MIKIESNKKILASALLILALNSLLHAQSTVASAGGDAAGSGGSLSYTIGQIDYHSSFGSNGTSMAEGVQQPYEISVISGIDNSNAFPLSISLFPNPVSRFLTLKVEDPAELSYRIYNLEGKLIASQKIYSSTSKIDLNRLANAGYLMNVLKKGKLLKSFKIIKN